VDLSPGDGARALEEIAAQGGHVVSRSALAQEDPQRSTGR
jgi:hypothetical protein